MNQTCKARFFWRRTSSVSNVTRLTMLICSAAQVLRSSHRGFCQAMDVRESMSTMGSPTFWRCLAFSYHSGRHSPLIRSNTGIMRRRSNNFVNTHSRRAMRHNQIHELSSSLYHSNGGKEAGQKPLSFVVDEHNVDEHNWRLHPSLLETYRIPTVFVKNDSLQTIIKELGPYLATRKKEFEDIHPRLKAIQNPGAIEISDDVLNNISDMKVVLLNPDSVSSEIIDINEQTILNSFLEGSKSQRINALSGSFPKMAEGAINLLADAAAFPGPIISKSIPYEQQPIHRILSKILPKEAQPPPTGFEQIGHVIHLNLKEKHVSYRNLIGSVILDRLSPKIQSVVNKVGEVSGPYRTYNMELLAGKPETTVEVIEDGVSLHFDLSKVYWCTRLSGERSRMLKEEFQKGQIVADAFCGVGALCVLAASKLGCTIYANDLNPDAVKFLKESIKKNRRRIETTNNTKERTQTMPSINVQCGDAFDFIQNLGSLPTLPHHVVMNYPLDSASFLGAFRWWPKSDERLKTTPTVVHLYTFARGDDPASEYGKNIVNPRSAVDVAIDLVADGLLPEGGAIKKSRFRKTYLDKLGCDVKAQEVRDVAPGKVVICVSFKISPNLLSVMQGDFIDID